MEMNRWTKGSSMKRLLSMVRLFKSTDYIRPQELADRYGVSVETIYRDLKLLEESGEKVPKWRYNP
jgi:predicted DNA-binding transcriptional regulator YafY